MSLLFFEHHIQFASIFNESSCLRERVALFIHKMLQQNMTAYSVNSNIAHLNAFAWTTKLETACRNEQGTFQSINVLFKQLFTESSQEKRKVKEKQALIFLCTSNFASPCTFKIMFSYFLRLITLFKTFKNVNFARNQSPYTHIGQLNFPSLKELIEYSLIVIRIIIQQTVTQLPRLYSRH